VASSRRKLLIRGVDFIAARYVNETSLRFGPLEIGSRIGRASFDIGPGVTLPFALEDEEYVEITASDGVTLDFTGKLRMTDRDRQLGIYENGHAASVWTVTAQDWGADLDRINVVNDFNVTAGDNDKNIVEMLLALYWPQISTDANLRHIVNSKRVNMPAVAITQGQVSLREALDAIAAEAFNATWWVDPYKRLHWHDVLTVTPYVLSDDRALFGSPDWVSELIAAGASSFWPLSEPYGTSFADSYGVAALASTGVVTPGRRSLTALPGSAMTFGGGRLTGPAYNFTGTGSFSLGIWVRPTTIDANSRRLFSYELTDGGGAQGWRLSHSNSGVVGTRQRDGAATNVSYATPFQAGAPYFVVLTYDGTNQRLYVNGALVGGPTASATSIKAVAATFTIGAYAPDGSVPFLGDIDEPAVADGIVWSAAQIAAMYAAGSRKYVGYAQLTDRLDGTSKAVRVTVIGTGGEDTVTDWPEFHRLRRAAAYERGAPATRIPQLNDVTDMNLTTSARRVQRGFQELDVVRRRRTLVLRTYDHGLYPGQQVDIIDADAGTGSVPYVSTDDAALFAHSNTERLWKGKGRFYVQRVTPQDRGAELWEYEIEVGSYLPSFEQAVGG
jgi:hypothetical protein